MLCHTLLWAVLYCCCVVVWAVLYGRCCLVIMMVISCRGLNIGAQGIAPAAQPAATTSSGSYFSSKSCLNQAHIFERGPNFWILRMLTLGSFALFCFCCQWQSLDSCKLTAEVLGWYRAGAECGVCHYLHVPILTPLSGPGYIHDLRLVTSWIFSRGQRTRGRGPECINNYGWWQWWVLRFGHR